MTLGHLGPAQSDDVFHFAGRSGTNPTWVPLEIRIMSPQEKLRRILTEEKLLGFRPFSKDSQVTRRCVCFSEANPEHLAYLMRHRGYRPWGLVFSRAEVLSFGGGAVAYLGERACDQLARAGLGHWAVRTTGMTDWMYERKWRIPLGRSDDALPVGPRGVRVRAILVGDRDWRPVSEGSEFPRLWRSTPVWVWDKDAGKVEEFEAGALA